MNEQMVQFILNHPLFSQIRPESIMAITGNIMVMHFKVGQLIMREGDDDDGLYLIQSGSCSARKRTEWGERELCVVKAPELFGEMEILSPSKRLATIIAREDTILYRIDQAGVACLVATENSFVRNLAKELVLRIKTQDSVVSAELYKSYRALTFALANLTDSRDPETGSHLARTRSYCAILAELLSRQPRYKGIINADFIDNIYNLSPLHDIGKVAVPDVILRKPQPLTVEEFEIMKNHTTAGALAFDQALHESDNYLFRMGRRICLSHHERWNGLGYPQGLRGEEIPIEARIMALADVYDALLSKRVYKEAFSYGQAMMEIRRGSGNAFDPLLADLMLENIRDFEQVNEKYVDTGSDDRSGWPNLLPAFSF